MSEERKAKAMQEVLENAQKQAKEDKSKNMQKKRHNLDEVKAEINVLEKEVVNDDLRQKTDVKPNTSLETNPKQSVTETVPLEQKEVSKLAEVEVTLKTSPSRRQKLLTPSKFRNQTCTSVAIQTETLK